MALDCSPEYQTSFKSTGLSVQEFKIDFQDCRRGSHLGFLIRMILAIFALQITQILPTKFPVNWPFDSAEVQNRFARWQQSLIYDQNDLAVFDLQVAPILPTKFQVN